MKKIVVVGSANTDMVIKSERIPLPGETILGGDFFMNMGGKGANQAVAAARMGGVVTMVAKTGNDIFGKQTVEGLDKEKIFTGYIFTDDVNPSGTALIMVNGAGENCIAVAPGSNANLLPEDIQNVPVMQDADVILMQLEIPIQTVEHVAAAAKKNKQAVILNPAPARALSDELLKGLYLVTPNESEAFLLTGVTVTDESSASRAADVFLGKGVQNVIITMGSKGAFFKNAGQSFLTGAPDVVVLDSTAAGDTFNGAIAVAITENMEWRDAVRFAITAASVSVTRLGAQASIPYRQELTSL
ncbi:MAG: ribokinase [Chitinophagaceae bacterium]|nr:ribokinase [Chitinophagaceae bacterium]